MTRSQLLLRVALWVLPPDFIIYFYVHVFYFQIEILGFFGFSFPLVFLRIWPKQNREKLREKMHFLFSFRERHGFTSHGGTDVLPAEARPFLSEGGGVFSFCSARGKIRILFFFVS